MEVSILKQNSFEPKTISPFLANCSVTIDSIECWHGVDHELLPIIDYTMFKSDDPAQRSKSIEDLGKWCREYGFFIVGIINFLPLFCTFLVLIISGLFVKNHPVPLNLIRETIDKLMEFFDQPEEEKRKYDTRDPDDRIRLFKEETNIISREFLYVTTHPTVHCPSKPPALTETVKEFSEEVRGLGLELLTGMSKALGVEDDFFEKKFKLESGHDFLTVNDYPARQSPTNRMGQLEHTDTGFFTLITQNTNGGLQLEHNGKWLNVNIEPDWIACVVADLTEVLTNGKFKAANHRVILNSEVRRLTPPYFMGPSLDTFVCPAPEFVDDSHPPRFLGMTYKQFLENNGFHVIDGRSSIAQLRL